MHDFSFHLISPAYAQSGGGDMLTSFLPFILIFVVFYFLLIRPQMKRQKDHRMMTEGLKPGDRVTTSGGIMGRVTKAAEGSETIDVEIARGVTVEVVRGMVSDARDKSGKPLGAAAAKPKSLFGMGASKDESKDKPAQKK